MRAQSGWLDVEQPALYLWLYGGYTWDEVETAVAHAFALAAEQGGCPPLIMDTPDDTAYGYVPPDALVHLTRPRRYTIGRFYIVNPSPSTRDMVAVAQRHSAEAQARVRFAFSVDDALTQEAALPPFAPCES